MNLEVPPSEAQWIETLIHKAFAEDIPEIDVTTDNLDLKSRHGTARLVAKSDVVLSGSPLFTATVLLQAPETQITWLHKDGQTALKGQAICTLAGNLIPILKAERVALNFLQHLSGIATLTAQFVGAARGTSCQIIDTRKTTPGFRWWEKQAVRHGGGTNHRLNLSDAVMIKDNHIAVAGGITAAVQQIRKHHDGPICIEARTMDEIKEAVACRPERILIDNMSAEQTRAALREIPSNVQTEASGNMTLARIKDVAATGVQFISVGQLTHSAPAADISLIFDWI